MLLHFSSAAAQNSFSWLQSEELFTNGSLLGFFAGPATEKQKIQVRATRAVALQGRYLVVQMNNGKENPLHLKEVFVFGQGDTRVLEEDCHESCMETCSAPWEQHQDKWEQHGDKCYLWSQEKMNWTNAELACRSEDGHLASVASQDVHDYLAGRNLSLWLGGSDRAAEGNWTWTDCTEWNWTHWDNQSFGEHEFWPKQPDDNQEEDCAFFKPGRGWHDGPCWVKKRFVCVRPMTCRGVSPIQIASVLGSVGTMCLCVILFFLLRRRWIVTNPEEVEAEKNPDYGSLYYMDGQKLENKTGAEDSNPYYKQM